MKYLALLATITLAACTSPKAYPLGPNPLDFPGETQATAAEMHADNIREITRPR